MTSTRRAVRILRPPTRWGVDFETLDITGLEAELETAPHSDTALITLLEHLLSGSRNHLAAFQRQVDRWYRVEKPAARAGNAQRPRSSGTAPPVPRPLPYLRKPA